MKTEEAGLKGRNNNTPASAGGNAITTSY